MSNIKVELSVAGASSSRKDLKKVFLRRFNIKRERYGDSSGEIQLTIRDKSREFCLKCKERLNFTYGFCPRCDVNPWTSGNQLIDEFILKWQSRVEKYGWFEWIPYDEFTDIEFVAKGGFGAVHKAIWKKGPRNLRLDSDSQWSHPNILVAFKRLDGSKNHLNEFLREATCTNSMFLRFYGITQDPETKDYLMVIEYADCNLRDYLKRNRDTFTWHDKGKTAYILASSMNAMHNIGIIHCDLHSGNVLVFEYTFVLKSKDDGSEWNQKTFYPMISDFSLARPLNFTIDDKDDKKIFGVLPYIAPEVLCGKEYTKASDVYSYGIILWELTSCQPPYADRKHDSNLVIEIIEGLRPEITPDTPEKYRKIINRCWDPNPEKRPSFVELQRQFGFHGSEGSGAIFIWPRIDYNYQLDDPCLDTAELSRRLELLKLLFSGKAISECHPEAYTYSRPLSSTIKNVKVNDNEINDDNAN